MAIKDTPLVVLMGIPGSGKTTFAEQKCKNVYYNNYKRLDLDKHMNDYKQNGFKKSSNELTQEEILERVVKNYFSISYPPYIIDVRYQQKAT